MDNEIILDLFLRKTKLTSFVNLLLISLVIVFAAFTSIDLMINDDSLSSKPVLSKENVQYEIRVNETKFREQIFKELSSLYLDNKFSLIDSISKNQKEIDLIKKTIVLNKLKSTKSSYKFNIPINETTTPLVELAELKTIFDIDFERLYDILQSSTSKAIEDNTKYGNFLKTSYQYEKKLKIDYIIIFSLVIIVGLVLVYFIKRIGLKNKKEKLEQAVDNLKNDKEFIKEAQNILSDDTLSKNEIEKLKKLVNKLELNLKDYDFDNILESVLYEDLLKSERRSLELYNRSTLMLILGLLVAIAGILVFYFTLPSFTNAKTPTEYLALTIRPTLILLFIQSVSFYLLRQYRSLINDYKYFYSEYLKKAKIFIAYQLMQSENISTQEVKLIDTLLTTNNDNKVAIDLDKEIPNDKLLDVLKVVIEKFK